MQPLPQKYGSVAIFLHWLMAAGLALLVPLGLLSASLDESDAATRAILALHKSIGITIFGLVWLRALWRLTHPAPPLPSDMRAIMRRAAAVTHFMLYAIVFVMPVTGYIAVAARGRDTTYFGLFDVPQWVPLDRVLALNAQTAHDLGQYVLYALLAAHIGAAAFHRYVLKDQITSRMWPGRQAGGRS